jgi:hypothetical protein
MWASLRCDVVRNGQFAVAREVAGEIRHWPCGTVYAKTMGILRSLCGADTTIWHKFLGRAV